jgi:hypothetical protein
MKETVKVQVLWTAHACSRLRGRGTGVQGPCGVWFWSSCASLRVGLAMTGGRPHMPARASAQAGRPAALPAARTAQPQHAQHSRSTASPAQLDQRVALARQRAAHQLEVRPHLGRHGQRSTAVNHAAEECRGPDARQPIGAGISLCNRAAVLWRMQGPPPSLEFKIRLTLAPIWAACGVAWAVADGCTRQRPPRTRHPRHPT